MRGGNYKWTQKLLELGADANSRDEDLLTPMIAVNTNDNCAAIIDLLISYGANV